MTPAVSNQNTLTDPFVVPKATPKKSELDMDAFMRLLTVQLANQNPLEPMNDRDYFAQMAQLGQVQGIDTLNNQARVEQAQSLMGKTVTAVRPNFVSDPSLSPVVTGVVSKLSIINGKYNISIQEPNGGLVDVNIDAIQSVVPRANPNEYAYAIGKSIKATTPDGKTVEGRVSTVAAQGGNIVISVKGSDGKLTTISPSGIISLGELLEGN
jgi:flagellar basal-body rod modification protein FlgD